MLKRLYAITTWTIALAFILLAVTVSVARAFLPLVAEERALVEARVGEMLGQPIRIAAVEAEIRWLIPRIHLQSVQMLDPAGEQVLLEAEQFIVDIDPLDSLLALAPRIRQVSVRGVDLEVTRTADNRLVVLGVWEQSLSEAARKRPGEVGAGWEGLRDLRFNVGESRVHWVDEPTGRDLVFENIQLAIARDGQRLRVAGRLTPPTEMGESLQLVADLRGDLHRPGGWSGSLYARGDSLHFPLLPAATLLEQQGLEEGRGSVELWSRWRNGRPVRIAGEVTLEDLRFRLAADAGTHRLERVSGAFLWEDRAAEGWWLQGRELTVERAGRRWPVSGFEAAFRAGEGERSLALSADMLRLEDVAPLAGVGEHLPVLTRERLVRLAPQGDLRDLWLELTWRDGELGWLQADGRVGNLGFAPLPELRLPGVSGVDAHFAFTREEGELLLATGGLQLEYPEVFEQPLAVDELFGTLHWSHGDAGWRVQTDRLALANADLRLAGTLELAGRKGESPAIDLQLDIEEGQLQAAPRYLPKILRPNVRAWLETALVEGRIAQGQLRMQGPLDRFPYRDGGGEFEVRFDVADTTLRYRPDWPLIRDLAAEVVFDGPGLAVSVSGGRLFDSQIQGGTVHIDDFRSPLLVIGARSRGPAGDMLRYLAESPLARAQADQLARLRATGPAVYELGLEVPLSRRLGRELSLDSRLHLEGVRLELPDARVTLTDLQGLLSITRDDIRADGLQARYGDASLQLSARRQDNGDLLIRGEGAMPPSELLAPYAPTLATAFEGSSTWLVHLVLPLRSGNATELALSSDLEGVRVALPSPLGKSPGEGRNLQLRAWFEGQAEPRFRVSYGARLESVFTLGKGSEAGISRAEIRLGDGPAQLPARGVRLAGRLAHFDPDDWRQALAPASTPGEAAPAGEGEGLPDWVTELELEIGETEVFGRPLHDLRISAEREPQAWRALVSAPAISGLITLPHTLSAAVPLQLELEHLDLDRLGGGEGGDMVAGENGGAARQDPRALPSLRVASGLVVFQGQRYRDLKLETARQSSGQQIHAFQVAHSHGELRAWGEWRVLRDGGQRSSFRFEAGSSNLGELVTQLGFATGISRGQAQASGDLAWSGAPQEISPEGLTGKVHLVVEKGQLTQVDPGAGRLLGLFNLSNLPRRLSLDFSDIFREGFAFDRIEGNLRFADQSMYTNDLRIEGPAARLQLTGRTGIADRSYDQTVVVHPQVGGTLPVAGALVGGPGVGAAVFFLQKLLPARSADDDGGIEYRVTGSWDDPVITRVSAPPPPAADATSPWP